MFKKLRNKFLALNMSIISIVMIAAFVIVYLSIYNNIKLENKSKLETGGITYTEETPKYIESQENRDLGSQITIQRFSLSDSLCFHIEVDENGQILSVNSFFDMSSKQYKKAVEFAWNQKENFSSFKLEGKVWMYAIKTTEKSQTIHTEGNQVNLVKSDETYQIMFLDITESNKTLLYLLYTLLFVGFIMLFVIFSISLYFANRAIKPIAQTWEKQKQFIADASHELKTPLAIIKSNYGAILTNQDETVKSQIKWLDYIKFGADRISKLVSDLLTLATLDNIDSVFINSSFDLSAVTEDVLQSMIASATQKDIHMLASIEPNIMIYNDSGKITQVLSILLDNAIKYTNDNGWITVSVTKLKRHVNCSVENSGDGIAEEDLPKVFDRFFRTDATRNSENGDYGLGLPIAKTIIEKAGGKLYVASSKKQSTIFYFTLKVKT